MSAGPTEFASSRVREYFARRDLLAWAQMLAYSLECDPDSAHYWRAVAARYARNAFEMLGAL
jgi:hypothetical protein